MSARDNAKAQGAARVLSHIGALAGSGPLTRIAAATNDMDHPRMDTPSLTRAADPATSREAATRIAGNISALQKRVLDFIRSRGASGCTDLDLQRRFGNHGSTYRTRRAELVALGLVRDSGLRVIQDGGRRIVWIAREHAAGHAA